MEASRARRAIVASGSILMLALMAGPAFAHHRGGHEGGPPDQQEASSDEEAPSSPSSTKKPSVNSETAVTEETDDDGVPNAPDPLGDTDNAHPSGNDKHVEAGGSGNQGKAVSDPDDDGRGPDRTNRGVDQPGGPGGLDILDQDGNNGCGNDDDFEDDNEGNCGGKPSGPSQNGGPHQNGGPTTQNPPTVAAAGVEAQIGPAGMASLNGGGGPVAGPPAPVPVPVPELAFTGANLDFLVRGMLALALLGAFLLSTGRRAGQARGSSEAW